MLDMILAMVLDIIEKKSNALIEFLSQCRKINKLTDNFR